MSPRETDRRGPSGGSPHPSVYSTVHVALPSEHSTVKVTSTPADRSTVVLEVEVTPEQLQRAIDEAVRHQSRRIRVPGFRPGKVPRSMLERAMGIDRSDPAVPDPIYDDAREHLYQRSVVDAVRQEGLDVLELPSAPEWITFEEGTGATYKVSAPIRPAVELGDYTSFPFSPEIDQPDDARVDAVVEQLRDQQASLIPVEDRGVQAGDFAVIGFEGRKDGVPVEGAASERFPLVVGSERMVPGFEDALIGMREEEERTFTVTFPEDYRETEMAGQPIEFTATLRELRERRLPPLDDAFAQSMGAFSDVAGLRADILARLQRNALDRARHAFADRIIEYAVANATVTPPDLLVEREIDVMIDELKVRLAQQQIEFEEYLKVTERDEAKLREESREGAEHRVKVLLVLGAVADKEQIEVSDAVVGLGDREDPPLQPRGSATHRISRVTPWALVRSLDAPALAGHRGCHRYLDRSASEVLGRAPHRGSADRCHGPGRRGDRRTRARGAGRGRRGARGRAGRSRRWRRRPCVA